MLPSHTCTILASFTHMHPPYSAGSLRDPLQHSRVPCLYSSLLSGAPPSSLHPPQAPWTLSSVSSMQGVGLDLPVLPPFAVETLKIVSWGSDMAHLTCFFHFRNHMMASILQTIVPRMFLPAPPSLPSTYHPTLGSKHGFCYSILARSRSLYLITSVLNY